MIHLEFVIPNSDLADIAFLWDKHSAAHRVVTK